MKKLFLLLISVIALSSCATRDEIVLFQDIDSQNFKNLDSLYSHPIISTNDILRIDVSALNEESLQPYQFNNNSMGGGGGRSSGNGNVNRQFGYLVNKNGMINYPGLGKVKVRGLSTQKAQDLIQEKLSDYIKDPTVRLSIMNFKVTFLGSVNGEMTLNLQEETVTIPQALGMVSGINIQGLRENVLLYRQKPNGERVTYRLNLTETEWMNEPYFYLKPNDMIYVEPNNPKVSSAGYIGSVSAIFGTISFFLSLATLLFR